MSNAYGYRLPATVVCPGCSRLVVLPAAPLDADTPPALCEACGAEVPDYRRAYDPAADLPPPAAEPPVEPIADEPLENRRFSRRGLFRSLGGIVADRGMIAVEQAKDRLGDR